MSTATAVTATIALVEPHPYTFPQDVSPNALAVLVSSLQIPSDCAVPSPQPNGEAAHPGGRAVPLQSLRSAVLQTSWDRAFPGEIGISSCAAALPGAWLAKPLMVGLRMGAG